MEDEIRQEVDGTFLAAAPSCRVSATTGAGVEDLVRTIEQAIAVVDPRDVRGPLRLPVDRTFTVPGFGTVVSGTLMSGSVTVGETVEVLPLGRKVRVRGVQVHGEKVERARAGQRTALNLADVGTDEVSRGSVVGAPGAFALTDRFDARLRLLPTTRRLEHRDALHLYLGTARTVATASILDQAHVEPGEEALVQVHLADPLVAHRRDRFVVRSYSPMVTVGGGVVIDPRPTRHKRMRGEVVDTLRALESGDAGFLARKLAALGCASAGELARLAGLADAEAAQQLAALAQAGQVRLLGDQWTTPAAVAGWKAQLVEQTTRFHAESALLPGIPLATARAALPVRGRAWEALLAELEGLEVDGEWLRRPGHVPTPTADQARQLAAIEGIYRQDGLQINSRALVLERLRIGADAAHPLFQHLVATGRLVRIDEDTLFHAEAYARALDALREHFRDQPTLTLSAFRDRLGAARKHVQALLEHFDALKYTLRRGDERVAYRLSAGDGG